jgi:hypothetical protein
MMVWKKQYKIDIFITTTIYKQCSCSPPSGELEGAYNDEHLKNNY